MDILGINIEFRQWNIQKVKAAEARGLTDSLRSRRGLIRYTVKTMIPLVVCKGQVAIDELQADPGKGADILPVLNILDKLSKIFTMGGQHRHQALMF
jgi:hypothetical protein